MAITETKMLTVTLKGKWWVVPLINVVGRICSLLRIDPPVDPVVVFVLRFGLIFDVSASSTQHPGGGSKV